MSNLTVWQVIPKALELINTCNVAIHIYAPQYRANPSPPFDQITAFENYTHAYFPQDRFDEVIRDGHWTLGRKGDGYIPRSASRDGGSSR